jgi:hypothetical protein
MLKPVAGAGKAQTSPVRVYSAVWVYSLLELQGAENSLITLDELAVSFAKNLAEHLANCTAQANRPGRFISALSNGRGSVVSILNRREWTRDQLLVRR